MDKKKGEIDLKKIIIVIIIIVLVAAGFVGYRMIKSNQGESDVKTIQLNEVTHSVFYAPQYVAMNQGFFRENQLEIEITTGQGSDKVMTAILSGQSDIGLAGPETSIYVYNEGKEDFTQVFAQLTKKDGSFLVSKTENQDFKWTDLKGKTVIPGRKGGVPYMTLEYIIKQNGMDPQKDLVLDDSIKFDLMAGAFTGGNAEYVTLFEPTASLTENAGKGYIVASVGEASGEIPYTGYCAKKSYIEQNQDTIRKFTQSIYKGQKWVKEHSAREVAESIQSFFPDTNLDLLTTVIQRYKDVDVWSDTPYLKEDSFERLQTVMKEAGELKQEVPYDKVINNQYANEVIENN